MGEVEKQGGGSINMIMGCKLPREEQAETEGTADNLGKPYS
jgi:hypothetical protein